jgi:hypothetical protein
LRLEDVLIKDPGTEQALRDFLGHLATLGVTLPATPAPQFQFAVRGGSTAGRDKITKTTNKKTSFFLPPVLFGHAAKAMATHWVVTTVTVVVVVGGASAGVALAHKGANTPVSSPTIAASTPAVLPPVQTSADWGALQGGPTRTGAQPDETRIGTGNVSKLAQARTYKTNTETGQSTAPLIVNGILYVATNELYAFDATGTTNCSAAPATCTPLWSDPASGSTDGGPPAVVNGVLFTGIGTVYAYSL